MTNDLQARIHDERAKKQYTTLKFFLTVLRGPYAGHILTPKRVTPTRARNRVITHRGHRLWCAREVRTSFLQRAATSPHVIWVVVLMTHSKPQGVSPTSSSHRPRACRTSDQRKSPSDWMAVDLF